METFKQLMAFPLYATAGYLVWVLAGQVSESGPAHDDLCARGHRDGRVVLRAVERTGASAGRARFGLITGVALLALGGWMG